MADSNQIVFFPVGNGDMSLIQVGPKGAGGKTILVDLKINGNGEPNRCDVLKELHSHLPKDWRGIPYVDLLVITHPDDDHVAGFHQHFFSGKDPEEYKLLENEDEYELILAKEIWFSEICTRRISKDHRLSDSAVALRSELKRRRNLFEAEDRHFLDGNRLKAVGVVEHDDNKKERWDRDGMVLHRGQTHYMGTAEALILGPFGDSIFDEENQESKNDSSVIIRWTVNGSKLLMGGDASAHIWRHVDREYSDGELTYDLLLAPHHCSWRTLSQDSSSTCDRPRVLQEAKRALSHCEPGAYVIASSKKVKSNDADPPSARAKSQYVDIIGSADRFICLADTGSDTRAAEVKKFVLGMSGVAAVTSSASASAIADSGKPIRHG